MGDCVREVIRQDNALIVRVGGEIDLNHSPDFHRTLVGLCAQKPARLALVLTDVTFMDSSGIGTLVEIYRRLKQNNARLFLVAPSDRVRSVLEVTKMDRFFTIVADEKAALDGP